MQADRWISEQNNKHILYSDRASHYKSWLGYVQPHQLQVLSQLKSNSSSKRRGQTLNILLMHTYFSDKHQPNKRHGRRVPLHSPKRNLAATPSMVEFRFQERSRAARHLYCNRRTVCPCQVAIFHPTTPLQTPLMHTPLRHHLWGVGKPRCLPNKVALHRRCLNNLNIREPCMRVLRVMKAHYWQGLELSKTRLMNFSKMNC